MAKEFKYRINQDKLRTLEDVIEVLKALDPSCHISGRDRELIKKFEPFVEKGILIKEAY